MVIRRNAESIYQILNTINYEITESRQRESNGWTLPSNGIVLSIV